MRGVFELKAKNSSTVLKKGVEPAGLKGRREGNAREGTEKMPCVIETLVSGNRQGSRGGKRHFREGRKSVDGGKEGACPARDDDLIGKKKETRM